MPSINIELTIEDTLLLAGAAGALHAAYFSDPAQQEMIKSLVGTETDKELSQAIWALKNRISAIIDPSEVKDWPGEECEAQYKAEQGGENAH